MEQATFAELEHALKKRRTRREVFLAKMDGLIPWGRLEERIEPFGDYTLNLPKVLDPAR